MGMYTVIVADDEYELRQAMIETIDWQSIGFEVVGEAENGAEALELVERLEPDLLLTDIKMPFISGIELARRVREIRPAMQIAFLSGYDDFQYAQQAIQYNIIKYLLKPISSEQLTQELRDIKRIMDERQALFITHTEVDVRQLQLESFLFSLLMDTDTVSTTPSVMKEMYDTAIELQLIRNTEGNARFNVMVSRFLDSDHQVITNHQHIHALDAIARKHVNCGSVYSEGKIITLLEGMQWELDKYSSIIGNEIIQTTKRVMNQECYIGFGGMFDQLSKAHSSYSEARNAIEYGQGTHLNLSFIHDIERKDSLKYEYIDVVSMELEKLMKSCSKEELVQYIEEVFSTIKVSTDVDLLIMHVISRLCKLVRSLCDDTTANDFFAKASILSSSMSKQTLEEKCHNIIDFCILCKDSITKQNRLNAQVICDNLMELIDQEYGKEEFSLSVASDRLFISASYLSALIKKTMGESFVVLLTKKRMEVAREKVLYSSAKVLDIANECGYSDQHYFSYCFKRQFGMSPIKMRGKQLNEKDEI